MKPQEQKREFIRLRAEGRSFSYIANALGMSKSTCTSWERELADKIKELKAEQLAELYHTFYMTKESRIKKLGTALQRIDEALAEVDLKEVPPEKLLDYKLKYTEALKSEYAGGGKPYRLPDNIDSGEIVKALGDLLNRVRAGEVTPEQANRESSVLASLLKAYDATELQAKLETLETILGGRNE